MKIAKNEINGAVLLPDLQGYLDRLGEEVAFISPERKLLLEELATYIAQHSRQGTAIRLHFICTHNSRRSQLAQVWAATAAHYFGIANVETFSGGTEVTAFNPRAIAALERAGFKIENPGGDNPHYRIQFSEEIPPLVCFSKTIDAATNPPAAFAALMTCDAADENCPFLPGAELRIPLTYEDPKVADDTPEESVRYDERVRQIGREMRYALQRAVSVG